MASLERTLSNTVWLTLRTTRFQDYLYKCKSPPSGEVAQWQRVYDRFRTRRRLSYAAMVQLVLRLLYFVYHINQGVSLDEQRFYNPLAAILMETYHFFTSATIVIVFLTLGTFAVVLDYMVCFRADRFIYNLGHQLLVENGQGLLTLNQDRLGSRPSLTSCTEMHQWLLQWIRLLKSIWQSSDLCFQSHRLDDFSYISPRLRARLVLYSAAIEFIFALFWLLLAVASTILLVVFLLMYSSSLTIFLFLFCDSSFIVFMGLMVMRAAFLAIHFGLVLSFVSNHYIDELNVAIKQIFRRSPLLLRSFLHHFYREHNRLLYMAEYTDKLFVSPLLFVMFFTVILLSIVTISCLLFLPLLFFEKCVMVMYIITSLAVPLFGCASLIGWSQAFCKPEPVLYRAQLMLGNRPLGQQNIFLSVTLFTAKLKLMVYYETVCTRNRFRFSMGPMGDISKRSLYEFCFAYSGMVMFISAMIRDEQLMQQS